MKTSIASFSSPRKQNRPDGKKRSAEAERFETVNKVGYCHPERSAAKSKDLKSPCLQDNRSFDSGFASAQDDNLIGLSTT
jgi:hypothetical protein